MRNFRNLANQKHESIKFDFMFSKYKIEFVDTLVYKDKNNILQTTLFKKKKQLIVKTIYSQNRHTCICFKRIAYKQALRIKTICSKIEEYKKTANGENGLCKKFSKKSALATKPGELAILTEDHFVQLLIQSKPT